LQVGTSLSYQVTACSIFEDAKIPKDLNRYRRKKASEIAGYLLKRSKRWQIPIRTIRTFSVIKLNHDKFAIRDPRWASGLAADTNLLR
jgi:hypothetical protein